MQWKLLDHFKKKLFIGTSENSYRVIRSTSADGPRAKNVPLFSKSSSIAVGSLKAKDSLTVAVMGVGMVMTHSWRLVYVAARE